MRTIVKELVTSLNAYTIVYDEASKMYFAINQNDIDENGCLTKQYNGISGHANKNIEDTVESVILTDNIRRFMAMGNSFEDAYELAMKGEMNDEKHLPHRTFS